MSMPAEKAMESILAAQDPKGLVESFPESDFYFLIRGIGFEDALPILSLASTKQWEYLFDVEIWDGDRIDLYSMSRWINRIYRADAGRSAQWLLQEKPEFIGHFFFKSVEVRIRQYASL